MKATHSLRWRIQVWHGMLLVAVLAGLGVAAYQHQWATELRRLDSDLNEHLSLLLDALPREGGRPPPPGQFAQPPPNRPRRLEFRLPDEQQALFDPQKPKACYFVLWRRDGTEWARSAGAPAEVPRPVRPPLGKLGGLDRNRGLLHEVCRFTPPGECLLVGRSMAPEMTAIRDYAAWLTGISGAILLLGLGGGWWITTRALRPLDAITKTAGHIAGGRLAERIDLADDRGELGQLATVLNSTFAQLETTFAQQAQFTADAAHELRTPVSVVISQAQLGLRAERSAEEYREMLDACLRAGRRMETLTQSLLELSRHDAGAADLKAQPSDLASLARESAELLQPTAAERQVHLEFDLAPAPCHADPDRIAQVILNLVTNALEHTPAGGTITVRTRSVNQESILAVSDTGPGIAPEHVARVFDRFYRVDQSRNRRTGGAGLGLAICQAIASAHGGTLTVESTVGSGSTFTLRLPGA